MEKGKKVKDFAPVRPRNIPGCQAWLEDQAARGLFLREYHSWFAVFEKGEPARVRYRLEAAKPGTSYASRETQEDYLLLGWEYVYTAGQFHIWRCGDPAVPELYTDPQTQGEAVLRNYTKRWKLLFLGMVLWLALVVLSIAAYARFGMGMTLFELHFVEWLWLMFLIAEGLDSLAGIRLFRYGRRLKKGIPQPNRGPYRLARVRSGAGAAVCAVVLSVSMLNILSGFLTRYSMARPLEEFGDPPPHVSLAALDPEAVPDRAEAESIGSPFAASAWRTQEVQWGEEVYDGEDRAWCVSEYYEMRGEFLAKVQELLLCFGTPVEELACPGADRALWGRSGEGEQLLVLRRGDEVLAVRYSGEGDLREGAEEAVRALSEG